MITVSQMKASDLYFDRMNPRMVEYQINASTPENSIIKILWQEMAIDELVLSIIAHGFFENEAMYAVLEDNKYVVVEGNRRLAAVKAILNPSIVGKGMDKYIGRITTDVIAQLTDNLPVIILKSREDAWRYIGFKHVNGAAKWGSYAKAQYIATVKNDYGISLDQIAEQIGDTNKTVKKLYQGLIVLNQANEQTSFKSNDVNANRIYFSHLYTALTYENYRIYLGLDVEFESKNPVSAENLSKLEEVMYWIFGSKSQEIFPVIKSQNPDLRDLNTVLGNPEAIAALKVSNDLSIALDLSKDGTKVLHEALVQTKLTLQKALSKLGEYDGNDDYLKIAGSIANSADALYNQMEKIKNETRGVKKERISE